jgi:uncharacterized membrane protein YgcG
VLGYMPHEGKSYLYQLSAVRGPLLWWGLGAAAYYYLGLAEAHAAEVAQATIAREQLAASTAEAHLQALQAQVEPHFLFNTLANVKWLYRRDPESGRRMLDRLVDYLHAALPRCARPRPRSSRSFASRRPTSTSSSFASAGGSSSPSTFPMRSRA